MTAAAGSGLRVSPTSAPQEDTADHEQSSGAKVPFVLDFLFATPKPKAFCTARPSTSPCSAAMKAVPAAAVPRVPASCPRPGQPRCPGQAQHPPAPGSGVGRGQPDTSLLPEALTGLTEYAITENNTFIPLISHRTEWIKRTCQSNGLF